MFYYSVGVHLFALRDNYPCVPSKLTIFSVLFIYFFLRKHHSVKILSFRWDVPTSCQFHLRLICRSWIFWLIVVFKIFLILLSFVPGELNEQACVIWICGKQWRAFSPYMQLVFSKFLFHSLFSIISPWSQCIHRWLCSNYRFVTIRYKIEAKIFHCF